MTKMRFLAALVSMVPIMAACGGTDTGSAPTTAKEAAGAFEEAAGGYEFQKATSLVDGAVAYGPLNSADPETVRPLNEGLGDGSVAWQVVVFTGDNPPMDRDAAKAVAFASKTFKPAGGGVYMGDSDFAYIANGNVVVTGPVLNGDTSDPTLMRWKAVLDEI